MPRTSTASDGAPRRRAPAERDAGPARLLALAAGVLLSLLGVLGLFYDSGFSTGDDLAADDLAGVLVVNGWRNVIYLVSGLLALAFASRHARRVALTLGGFYLVFGIWGLLATDHGIGSILDALPLADRDNAFHLVLGLLGLAAAAADGSLPRVPARVSDRLSRRKRGPKRRRLQVPFGRKRTGDAGAARSASGGRRRSRATPRSSAGDEPR